VGHQHPVSPALLRCVEGLVSAADELLGPQAGRRPHGRDTEADGQVWGRARGPVLDPEHTMDRLERGWVLYRRYFIWKWRRSLRKKQAAWPGHYDLSAALRLGTLTEMTEHLVCEYGGYPSLMSYLHGYAIVGDALASIVHPSRIISAADDPIIAASDLARLARPDALEVTCTEFGGHCGFVEGGSGNTWLEREVLATLERG